MQFKVIGWSHYSFTGDDGKFHEGYKFHVSRPSMSSGMHGEEVAALSISEAIVQKCGEPKVGNLYNVQYDQRGRVAWYQLVTGQQKIPGA